MRCPVAIVTGAGSGIGQAACIALVDAGYAVGVVDIDESAAAATSTRLRDRGARAIPVPVDVTDQAATTAAVQRVTAEFGTPTAVFAAAGIMRIAPFLDLAAADWRRTLEVNLTGTFITLQTCARAMIAERLRGAMVAVASVAARGPRPDAADYAASKAAVVSLVESASVALAPHGIRVNGICPGVVDTDMTRRNAKRRAEQIGGTADDALSSLVQKVPLGRAASAAEVAEVGCALLGDGFGYVTGQALNVCGGLEFD